MSRPRSYGSKAITAKAAESALLQMLLGATPEAFARFTVESLSGSWRVPPARIAAMLESVGKGRFA